MGDKTGSASGVFSGSVGGGVSGDFSGSVGVLKSSGKMSESGRAGPLTVDSFIVGGLFSFNGSRDCGRSRGGTTERTTFCGGCGELSGEVGNRGAGKLADGDGVKPVTGMEIVGVVGGKDGDSGALKESGGGVKLVNELFFNVSVDTSCGLVESVAGIGVCGSLGFVLQAIISDRRVFHSSFSFSPAAFLAAALMVDFFGMTFRIETRTAAKADCPRLVCADSLSEQSEPKVN